MSENGEGSLAAENEARLEALRSLAESSDIVKNSLLSVEQAQYSMGWKSVVNPTSAPISIVYNAMGPDASTALLTTNANEIYGVDIFPPDSASLKTYLDQWDLIDTDTTTLPPKRILNISQGRSKATPEFVKSLLDASLERRRANGYWEIDSLEQWSIERCLAIELKKMGVARESIKLDEDAQQAQLSFAWAYPSEEPKERKITYTAHQLSELTAQAAIGIFPPVDVLYEKSMQRKRSVSQPNDLDGADALIKSGGFVLLGKVHTERGRNSQMEKYNRKALGNNFSPVVIPEVYKQLMEKKYASRVHQNRYGWELYGAVKTAHKT